MIEVAVVLAAIALIDYLVRRGGRRVTEEATARRFAGNNRPRQ